MAKRGKGFGLGFNGHARKCDCTSCASSRAKEFQRSLTQAHRPKAPTSLQHSVFVRSYFRRQPNHWKSMPNTRALVRGLLKEVV